MADTRRVPHDLVLEVVEIDSCGDLSKTLRLKTQKGDVSCCYFPVSNASSSVLWVGGIENSQGTPIQVLFEDSAKVLTGKGIASLQVDFRNSGEFEDSEHDVEAGLSYLYREGFRSVALVGHSFGGAVVIRVATRVSMVRTVVTLASQSSGADGVADLGVDCSILLLHGTDDPIVPHGCSQYLHELAQAEKKLLLCPGADHFFEPLGEIVQQRIREWIVRELNPDH